LAAGLLIRPGAQSPTEMRGLVWAVFSSLCILGGSATLFPHRCSPSISLADSLEPTRYTEFQGVRLVHGHHSTCGRFEDHEFKLKGKTLCSGCTGLLIGSIGSFTITTLHFVYNYRFPVFAGYLGLGFVVLGLLYIPLLKKTVTPLRLAFNAFFVLGFGLLLSAVDGLGDPVLDAIVIGLSVYWMFTRILLSRWSHDKVCSGCDDPCERIDIAGSPAA
jgi:hypothetical protein